MPLQRSGSKQAFTGNVRTLMGEVGKSPHVQSKDQALAIAYDIKRRNRDEGGRVDEYQQGDFQGSGPQMRVVGPAESIGNALDVSKPWGFGDTLNAMFMAMPMGRTPQNSMARKPYMIYNAPEKPPRPFEADYPKGAPSDAAGNLTQTIEGQPVTGRYVVGRNVVGGKDVALPQAEYDALTEATTGRSAEAAAPREMGSDLGRILVNRSSGRPEQIYLRSNLPADKVGMVHAHELGHAIDQIAGQILTTGLANELKAIFNTLNNPNRAPGGLEAASWGKPMTPKAAGYAGDEIPRELVAEATRAYLQNPNYIKTIAPNVAARIRAYVNAHPQLSKIIQFNTLAAGVGGAGMQSPGDGDMARGGALDVAYAIKRNRRRGGRLNRADGGDALLPDSEMPETEPPQVMQSGVGPTIPPFTRRQAELEDSDPFERAALRTRESVRPTSGRKEGPLMGLAGTALGVAAGPEAMLANYAPRIGGALYGLAGGMTPSEAGEQDFKWTDPQSDRATEMAAIQARINQRAAKITELGTTSTKSPAGTQKLAIDQLSALNRPDAPDVIRLNQLRAAAAAERDASFKQWQDKQEEDRLAAIERKKAETSLFDKIPGTRAALTMASPITSFLGGKYLGKRLSPYAAVPIGATTGAVEGAASIGAPTEIDINSLPRSSPTRQEAEADLDRRSYWQRVGLAAGVSGAAGALGATKGFASTRPIRKPAIPDVKSPPSAIPETTDVMQKVVQASRPKVPATEVHLPDGSVVHKYDYGNRVMWRDPVTKKLVKAPDLNTLRAQQASPSTALHAPPTQARGGGIRSPMDVAYAVRRQKRADGGAVHAGPILSSVPGRTDNHPMDVASGSYVLPADFISSQGEGNTAAGMEVLQHMLGGLSGEGGESQPGEPVPINAAGGEFVIAPQVVMAIGGGDIARGHKMLDEWVLMNRKKHISTLRKLPGPAKA